MLAWILLVATTIVSNIAVFSDQTGHGNQSHLVYAAQQQRWWLFYCDTKTATTVKTMVSSSNDLTTATWSAGSSSGTLTQALSTNDQRYLGVVYVPASINANDAVHVNVTSSASSASGAAERIAHFRATFTGASSITWEAVNEVVTTAAGKVPTLYKGDALGVALNGAIHRCTASGPGTVSTGVEGDPNASKSSNVDTGATWTNGWVTEVAVDDAMANACGAFALAPLASNEMLLVFQNASVSSTTGAGLNFNKTASQVWPQNTGNSTTGNGTTTQDQNDWAICPIDTTHIFCVRRSGSNTFDMRMYSGSLWSTKTAPPNQNHLAGSGVFLATDGTNLWMFVLDSASNQPVQYCKYTVGSDSWGSWTQLESAGSTARNYISGYPAFGNNQIGVIYTAVNGSNFDIVLSVLNFNTPSGSTATVWLLAA